MKKLLSVVLLALCMVSCTDVRKTNSEETISFVSISRFEYQGHTYISFVGLNGYQSGIVHDPDCKCHKLEQK